MAVRLWQICLFTSMIFIQNWTFASQDFAPRQPASAVANRFQTNVWVMERLNNMVHPLTEVVKVSGRFPGHGTGTLLEECRVITALHVLIGATRGERGDLGTNESLVGQWFRLDFRPLPGEREGTRSNMVVFGHGQLKGTAFALDSLEDWAIGYDQNCMHEKYGAVAIRQGADLLSIVDRDFAAAGYSEVPNFPWPSGMSDLFIDTNCGVHLEATKTFGTNHFFLADCVIWGGGSGMLLVNPVVIGGKFFPGPTGSPRLIAYGMFVGRETKAQLGTPYINSASAFVPFDFEFTKRFVKLLEGEVDISKYPKPAIIGPDPDLQ